MRIRSFLVLILALAVGLATALEGAMATAGFLATALG